VNNPDTYEIAGTYEIAAPRKSDADHVAGISLEKMNKRQNAPDKEAKPKSRKTDHGISLDYHQAKAGYTPIRPRRKCRPTQSSQNKLRIVRQEKFSNKKAIQARCKSLRESKGPRRNHETELSDKMRVRLKVRKCREQQPRRQRAHRCHLSTPRTVLLPGQGLQILKRAPGLPTIRISMPSKGIHESIPLSTIPCARGLGGWGRRSRAMRKACIPRPRSETANPRLDLTARTEGHTMHERRNHGLLCSSIENQIHSMMGVFFRAPTLG
jgi:hypothetical protein